MPKDSIACKKIWSPEVELQAPAPAEANEEQAAALSLMFHVFRQNQELRAAYDRLLDQTLKTLLCVLEERDPYTLGHSMRVMEYSLLIGRGVGLKESELRNLELAALFHDLGKIGVPDSLLLKPGKLTSSEQKAMELHPQKSTGILNILDIFSNVLPGVRHHHERIDGKGYPLGLAGDKIPVISRIILVADTFDAMTSTRPYRSALAIETAYQELEKHSGTQFDADFVRIFLREHKKLLEWKNREELPNAA